MMITINCTGVETPQQMHALLASRLEFPGYYGHNLDALFDCLTQIRRQTTIELEGWMGLGEWKERFANVFVNVELENPNLDIILK